MSLATTEAARTFLGKITTDLEELVTGTSELESMAETTGSAGLWTDAVSRAAHKLVRGEELDPEEQFVTEAIIIPDKRPAIDVQDGDFRVPHELWQHFEHDRAIRQRLKTAIASIGRVDLPGHPTLPYAGTAFVVGPDLLMTNRHVAEIFCLGLGIRNLRFRPGVTAEVDFLRERDRSDQLSLGVRDVVMIHPYWDMAILKTEGLGERQPALALSSSPIEDQEGNEIAVIGYPAFDPRNDTAVQNQVFGGIYNIKRLQPGKLGSRRSVTSFSRQVNAVTHDSSTLGGNSGSAVVSAATGQIVAVHFGGRYLDTNFSVATSDLAIDGRVVDTGVNFVGTASPKPDAYADAWNENENVLLGPGQADPVLGGSLSFTVPLTFSISVEKPR